MVVSPHVNLDKMSINYAQHLISKRSINCEYCNALMWLDEKLISSSNTKPKFGMCCLQGSVSLPPIESLPNSLIDILTNNSKESSDLRNAIRLYNSILAFTSVSENVDKNLIRSEDRSLHLSI